MTPLQRLPDWPRRLVGFFDARERQAFAWGPNDCITFGADGVLAITGVDLIAGLRGGWNGERAALRRLRRLGGLQAAVTSVLGAPLPSPALAQRGDVLLIGAARPFVALCDADRWASPNRNGLLRGPMSEAVLAWGVGRA